MHDSTQTDAAPLPPDAYGTFTVPLRVPESHHAAQGYRKPVKCKTDGAANAGQGSMMQFMVQLPRPGASAEAPARRKCGRSPGTGSLQQKEEQKRQRTEAAEASAERLDR